MKRLVTINELRIKKRDEILQILRKFPNGLNSSQSQRRSMIYRYNTRFIPSVGQISTMWRFRKK